MENKKIDEVIRKLYEPINGPVRKILYVHGFRSSGNSGTAATLRNLLPDCEVISPDLPINGEEAVELLHKIVKNKKIDVVVGTSMGGMLAQKLRGVPKILVNPSFHVSDTFRRNMGVVSYFKPRKDGATEFEITPEIVESYESLEENQFEDLSLLECGITFGLFGKQDDTVNCIDEFLAHYFRMKYFDGGHRLSEEAIREAIIPTMDYVRCTSFMECVNVLVARILKRVYEEVTDAGCFKSIVELFDPFYTTDIVGKYGLNITKLPSCIEPDPKQIFVEAVTYPRVGGYKAETYVAKGTKQEIIEKLMDENFPIRVNNAFARHVEMIEDD